MIVQLSKGELHLKKYTRGIKQKYNAEAFKGVTVKTSADITELQDFEIPIQNFSDANELVLKLLLDHIKIENKRFSYVDLEKLEQDGQLSDEDSQLMEKSIQEITSGAEVKKN